MRRSQELEFRVGVGEWKVVFLFKVFNAEAQSTQRYLGLSAAGVRRQKLER